MSLLLSGSAKAGALMHILFGDETNDRATQDEEFFIYGGLILSENQAVGVHRGMLDIRREYDLGHHEPIKFDTNAAGAVRLGRDRWTEVKARVLDLLNEIDAKFVAYCVHHDIAAGQTVQTRNEWAIGAVLYRFNQFMYTEVQDSGIVVLDTPDIDRLSIARINDEGLTFSEDAEAAPLDRIIAFTQAHIEWSHCLSACDVLLGAFRYCTNRPRNEVSREMARSVAPRIWTREAADGKHYAGDFGLILRPILANIHSGSIKDDYQRLLDDWQGLFDEVLE